MTQVTFHRIAQHGQVHARRVNNFAQSHAELALSEHPLAFFIHLFGIFGSKNALRRPFPEVLIRLLHVRLRKIHLWKRDPVRYGLVREFVRIPVMLAAALQGFHQDGDGKIRPARLWHVHKVVKVRRITRHRDQL